jgi:hypothetical protein
MNALPQERAEAWREPAVTGFGAPTRVFTQSCPESGVVVVVNTLICGGGVAAALYLLSLGWPPLNCLVPALGFALLGICLQGWVARSSADRVLYCPEGFVEVSAHGVRACRWEEIDAVWELPEPNNDGAAAAAAGVCVVQANSGDRFVFSNERLCQVESLTELIQRELCRRRFAQALEAFRIGAKLGFGPVTIATQGLTHGDEVVPWSTIDRVHASEGFIRINQGGKWICWQRALTSEIPNLLLFLTLIGAIVDIHRERY